MLTGGELPALVVLDAVVRLVPGRGRRRRVGGRRIRSCADCSTYPHYTRPASFGAATVPDVLLSGHHAEIERWRRGAVRRTRQRRPELIDESRADGDERAT